MCLENAGRARIAPVRDYVPLALVEISLSNSPTAFQNRHAERHACLLSTLRSYRIVSTYLKCNKVIFCGSQLWTPRNRQCPVSLF